MLWAVGILTALLYLAMPLSGDDYAYKVVWHYPTIYDAILHYPGYLIHHWLHVNGRLANFIASPLLNLIPKWLLAIFCGAAIWLMLYISLKWSGLWRRGNFTASLLTATVMFAFPWWDAMQLFDCQFNYVWASALSLTALWFVTRPTAIEGHLSMLCVCLIATAGGMMHESASLPLLAGCAVWWWGNRHRQLPHGRKAVLLCFAAGTFAAISSPGIWHRATADAIPNDTIPLLFLKSFAIVGVLWLTISISSLWPSGRRAIKEMLHTPLLILAVATIPAVVIGLKSGIVGRSGWFGSLYALIVLMNLCQRLTHAAKPTISIAAAWGLALIVTSQLTGTTMLQLRRGADHLRFERAYAASPDGVVYLDHMRDTDLPWWTLGRTRGIPDPDDVYLMETFRYDQGADAPYPIVLPRDAEGATPAPGKILTLRNGDIISDILPDNAIPHPMKPGRPQLFIYRNTSDRRLWTAQTFHRGGRTLYHLAPLILDPGDRLEGPGFADL